MNNHRTTKTIRLFAAAFSVALGLVTNAETARSTKYSAGPSQVIITDLGLLPGGTTSAGLAINSEPVIVGLATDSNLDLQRPFWDANTGAIVGFADNFDPASTAVPEHLNNNREMAGTEVISSGRLFRGIYWNAAGDAFGLPPLAGIDPQFGAVHIMAHGINNLGQIVGSSQDESFASHTVLWPNKDTRPTDLGALGDSYGINDFSHVVGNIFGSTVHGFLWRNGNLIQLSSLNGQVVSEAYAVNNAGRIAGKSNIFPVIWNYDVTNNNSVPVIEQLPIPAGFFAATGRAVNDTGDVAGYAGSPNIDSHAILWRNGIAIDLGVWPGGHYSVANGINNLGQVVGTGTVAGNNLDHALMWTVDDGGGIPCEDLVSFQVRCKSTGGGGHKLQARLRLSNTSHSGEQVTITVDDDPIPVTINGDRAQLAINNPALGEHTVTLTDPAGCFPPAVPSCD
jgi:probable HAF family extracellular repeat protein